MVVMTDSLETDCWNLWANMKKDEKRLVQKRRWILGLPAFHDKKKASKDPKFFQEMTIPEYFLREDDLFIDKLKKASDNFYTGCRSGKSNLKIIDISNSHIGSTQLITLLLSHLSEMTNTGLMELMSALTPNPSQYIRTRTKMEKFIRNYLRELLKKHKSGYSDGDSIQKLSKFLKDSNNFDNTKGLYRHRSILVKHEDIHSILSNLEFAPYHILDTMLRKLRGIIPYCGKRKQANLVYEVRHACLDMLVQSDGEDDEYMIPDLLAMTMDCFIRSMESSFNCGDGSSSAVKLYHFSPDKEALMDEIVFSLHVMQKKMSFTKLEKFRHVLGVDEGVSNRQVRPVIKETLIDYLFNCGGDVDTVPDSLIKFLKLTNGPRNKRCSRDDTKEEIECVLSVGASMKQILWDSLLDHDIDQDFADAFMEDLEDSDDGEFECSCWVVRDSDNKVISNLCSTSMNEFADDMVDVKPFRGVDLPHQRTKSVDDDTPITCRNEYLDVQDVCDNVSAVTYSLIGCLLDRYGEKEGSGFCVNTRSYLKHDILTDRDIEVRDDEHGFNEEGDYIFHLVKTLIPEFPESGRVKLDELMKI